MLPLYAARIEDLGQGDFVKVDCAACHHVALLTPAFLLCLGLSPQTKVLDLKGRVRCRGCGKRGRAVVSDQVAAEQVSRAFVARFGLCGCQGPAER
jgi:ribosomal protein S27E